MAGCQLQRSCLRTLLFCWLCVVQGAVAAGMKVVVVPSMVGSQDEEFKVTVQEEGSNGSSSAGGEGGHFRQSAMHRLWDSGHPDPRRKQLRCNQL